MMEGDNARLVSLFERKINLLLENNIGYARFKKSNPEKLIKKTLSRKDIDRKNIIDLGFLIHLQALKFRLRMYQHLIPFSLLNFNKDFQDLINSLHAYQRQRNPQIKPVFELTDISRAEKLIPPLLEITEQTGYNADNPELYSEILSKLEEDSEKINLDIPEEIIKQMQDVDLRKVYNDLPVFISKQQFSTVRNLASTFPVFENDKLSLVAVFNEVLFLANEGKVELLQVGDDIEVTMKHACMRSSIRDKSKTGKISI